MQVQASSLDLSASHATAASVEVEDRLEIRVSTPSGSDARPAAPAAAPEDSVELVDARTLLTRWLFEYLTGRKAPAIRAIALQGVAQGAVRAAPARSWGISYSHREVRTETESTSFAAIGTVTLRSGEQIAFSLRLDLARQETSTSSLTIRAGNMTDPLVVNLDGIGARLTADREAFDLDGDGVDELVARLAAGSAWLARDRNGNGAVDNGGELFGPASGDGFAELAALDQDGNGWLDEGDAVYSQLGLWRDDVFVPLTEADVGALSVASLGTGFALQAGEETLGQVRSSGVYLREDGTAGVMQQVDLSG
jgi:hypothetical protein